VRTLLDLLLLPFNILGGLVKLLGRLAAGAVGVLVMTAGLFLWQSLQMPSAGLAVMALGLLLAIRAVF
jgi:hypothetical protein